MTPMVLTLIGDDKPGLVNAASAAVAAHGGTWLESRLARLAGKFAGIVLIAAPDDRAEALTGALRALDGAGLKVTVERGAAQATPSAHARHIDIEIVGHERPGIVRDLTQALKNLGANIEEFSSGVESAAFTGAEMFRANIRVALPDTLSLGDLKGALEKLAGEIMVDLTLGDE
ncbi:MAG TPA: ACT domain-containing protein [Beijerinckiaceae bacterium]|nr:amino acid-binding protein [Rhodoblastus sp.]HRY02437.1 ACT domain-containing protein [Beijerinckiaceae bacterium]